MHRAARSDSCGACKRGAAAKLADDYGRALRLTTVFRCFEYGTNTEMMHGRSCSIFGACQIFRSSTVTSTPQNARAWRETVAPHARFWLNRPNRLPLSRAE